MNAYKCEEIAKKLINDLRWFNLWSNICIDKFGYGRDAASSSPVESEIKNIKHPLMKSQSSHLRPDAFIDLHINHWIKGRMNMIGAKEDALLFNEKSTIMNGSSCVSGEEVSAQSSVRSYENDTFELEEQPQKSPLQCLESRKVLGVNHIYSDSESDKEEIDSDTTLGSLNSSENEKLCCECRKIDSVPIILGSRMEENWRGLIVGKQSPMKKKIDIDI